MPLVTNETLIAAIGAIGGGVLVKLADVWYKLRERKLDVDDTRVKDARADNAALRDELRNLDVAVETWQQKYYALFEMNALLKAKYELVATELAQYKDAYGGDSHDSKTAN